MNPGDTPALAELDTALGALNEGRGVNPGDTRPDPCRGAMLSPALNEGRGVNPGDTRPDGGAQGRPGALNEGRGVNPGDTRRRVDPGAHRLERSTKAGA